MKIQKCIDGIDYLSQCLGHIASVALLLLLANVLYDVFTRYLLNDVSIGMQELEWHLFSAMFLLAMPYALKNNGHVRVDILYEKFSATGKAWVDMLGALLLLMPFALLVAWYGAGFSYEAFLLGEQSGDPGGLPWRWIIKSVIPFASIMLFISGLSLFLRSLQTIMASSNTDVQASTKGTHK